MNIRQDKLGFRPFPTVYLDGALRGYHSVHRGLGKRVELLVVPPHEVWLEQEPAVAIVLELPYQAASQVKQPENFGIYKKKLALT